MRKGFRGNVECDLHCERKSCGMDGNGITLFAVLVLEAAAGVV